MQILERRDVPGLASLYVARLRGGPERLVEFVDTLEPGVAKDRKWVLIVSTQSGCPVGCRMCDAGALGFRGNLSAEEILAQVRFVVRSNPGLDLRNHPKVKVHLARMGEPSLNPSTLRALELLAEEFPHGGVIPSLSTVAPRSPAAAAYFDALIGLKDRLFSGGRFQLQFSLHSTDESERARLAPVRKWSLDEVASYGIRFHRAGDRKLTLNFALAPGAALDAERLEAAFCPEKFLVKITPVNPTGSAARAGLQRLWTEAPAAIAGVAAELRRRGFEVILSPSLPEEIAAETSCGQLWSAALKSRAAAARRARRREAAGYATSANLAEKAAAWSRAVEGFRRAAPALRPDGAGLLVVDAQRLFLDPLSPSYLPPGRAVLGNMRRLAAAFRAAGRPVYFTRHAHADPAKDGGLMTRRWSHVCLAGSREARLADGLEPERGRSFRKVRYSAFGGGRLAAALRRDGVEQLVVCGLQTNLCVESTVREAFDRGWETFVALDACAARSEELHVGSLKSLAQGFSTVLATRELLALLPAA